MKQGKKYETTHGQHKDSEDKIISSTLQPVSWEIQLVSLLTLHVFSLPIKAVLLSSRPWGFSFQPSVFQCQSTNSPCLARLSKFSHLMSLCMRKTHFYPPISPSRQHGQHLQNGIVFQYELLLVKTNDINWENRSCSFYSIETAVSKSVSYKIKMLSTSLFKVSHSYNLTK